MKRTIWECVLIIVGAWFVGLFVTPPDPISHLIFVKAASVVGLGAYWLAPRRPRVSAAEPASDQSTSEMQPPRGTLEGGRTTTRHVGTCLAIIGGAWLVIIFVTPPHPSLRLFYVAGASVVGLGAYWTGVRSSTRSQ